MPARSAFRILLVTLAGLSAACSPQVAAPPATSADILFPGALGGRSLLPSAGVTSSGKIQHVVIVVQENRSFDNLFAGFPGADTAASGLNSKGQRIPLQPIALQTEYEIDHFVTDFLAACDGNALGQNCKMDGFDKEQSYGENSVPNPQYAYVPHSQTQPYFDMARQYVLADRMFTSQIDASFPAHQYIIAGQAGSSANVPSLKWGCNGGPKDHVDTLLSDRTLGPTEPPCFDYQTLGDELDAKGLPWRFYSEGPAYGDFAWSAYQAVKHIYHGPDWKRDVKWPSARFLEDVAEGRLAAVTWITPSERDSDHPAPYIGSDHGPDWVATVVNAVGQSKFWDTSAVVVFWDDWGGWYDHVPPPYVDFDGLGFRVPLMVLSPYAKKGYVSHVQYEQGSILKFVEDTFGLGRLAASDTRANSLAPDCFDFTQPPRAFVPFVTSERADRFLNEPPDPTPLDEE